MKRPSLVVGMALLLMTSSCSREKELQDVVNEISALDTAVEATLRASPNEEGLSKSEALVEASRAGLHARIVSLREVDGVDPGDRLGMACLKNSQSARIASDYVANAVLKSNPELRGRATKLSGALCGICVTSTSDNAMCASFRDPSP